MGSAKAEEAPPVPVAKRVGMLVGRGIMLILAAAGVWFWYSFFTMPAGVRPVTTCVCPYDNGRPPSRQPTEDDYYSTPPGVNYAPR